MDKLEARIEEIHNRLIAGRKKGRDHQAYWLGYWIGIRDSNYGGRYWLGYTEYHIGYEDGKGELNDGSPAPRTINT